MGDRLDSLRSLGLLNPKRVRIPRGLVAYAVNYQDCDGNQKTSLQFVPKQSDQGTIIRSNMAEIVPDDMDYTLDEVTQSDLDNIRQVVKQTRFEKTVRQYGYRVLDVAHQKSTL